MPEHHSKCLSKVMICNVCIIDCHLSSLCTSKKISPTFNLKVHQFELMGSYLLVQTNLKSHIAKCQENQNISIYKHIKLEIKGYHAMGTNMKPEIVHKYKCQFFFSSKRKIGKKMRCYAKPPKTSLNQ